MFNMPVEKPVLSADLRAIERILRFLVKLSNNCYDDRKDVIKDSMNKRAYDAYNFLSKIIRPTRFDELNHLIENEPNEKLQLEVNNFYLPPFYKHNKEFVPVLRLKANFSKSVRMPKLDLRIALVTIDYAKSKLCIFGYRYEMPHTEPEQSEHNYCHQQFTRKPLDIPEENEGTCEMVAEWVPEQIPCTMIPAKTPVEHLVCMLIGLYGSRARDLVIKMNIGAEHKKPLEYLA